MRIHLSDPELVDGLLSYLERIGFAVAASEVATVVEIPDPRGGADGRAELELYLRLWETMHPNAEAALVD